MITRINMVHFLILYIGSGRSHFFECYHDPAGEPDEGPLMDLQFSCLGILQYIHIKNGTPHYYRAPRVVLIARQFVLSTAVDASDVPTGYALGNVVFSDYERDETECKVTVEQLARGAECSPAVLLMPIADVLLHPEYKDFGARNGLALLKLIRPVTSNFKDTEECKVPVEQLARGAECSPAVLLMPIADVLLHPEYKDFGARNGLALLKLLRPVTSNFKDTEEYKVTVEQLARGAECSPAVLLMPIADVLLHPEFKDFGARIGLALLKLIRPVTSNYMLPACLPHESLYDEKTNKVKIHKVFYVDFTTDVPRDYADEDKDIQIISILPKELCLLNNNTNSNHTSQGNTFIEHFTCSTGCGLHSGAPSFVHGKTGYWSIIMISLEYFPCPDPLRPRRAPPPPTHLELLPYVPWITNAISGVASWHQDIFFAHDDPFGYTISRMSPYRYISHRWIGHWWMGGVRCYDRGHAAKDLFRFYKEEFQVTPSSSTYMTYHLELVAPGSLKTACVKVGMPHRYSNPSIQGLETSVVKISIPTVIFYHVYHFEVEAWAYNASKPSKGHSLESSSLEHLIVDSDETEKGPFVKGVPFSLKEEVALLP